MEKVNHYEIIRTDLYYEFECTILTGNIKTAHFRTIFGDCWVITYSIDTFDLSYIDSHSVCNLTTAL